MVNGNTTPALPLLCCLALFNFSYPSYARDLEISFTNESFFSHNGVIRGALNHQTIGSAFVLGPNKDVVTCWHVAEAARIYYHETNLLFVGGDQVRALKLKAALPEHDLAVFSTTPEIPGVPFHAGDFGKVNVGDTILYVGYDTRALSTNHAAETRSSIGLATVGGKFHAATNGVETDLLGFIGEAIPGYSGGAVYTTNMEIVAVINLSGTQKVNAAVSIKPVVDLIMGNTEKSFQRREKTNAGSVYEQGKETTRDYVTPHLK